jgi:DNA-binding beta-propeller fold protein YncE
MGKFVVAGGKRVGGQPPKRLTFVDGSTFEVVSRLKVGSEPGSMAYNSATKTLYVCNYADNTISVIGN